MIKVTLNITNLLGFLAGMNVKLAGPSMERMWAKVGKFVQHRARTKLRARSSRVSTGELARSIQYESSEGGVSIYSDLEYAAVQNRDGYTVIRPKKMQWLAIPGTTTLARKHVWPSAHPGRLYFVLKDQDTAFLFERGHSRPAYVLKKEVNVKGNPFLVWDRETEDYVKSEVGDILSVEQ